MGSSVVPAPSSGPALKLIRNSLTSSGTFTIPALYSGNNIVYLAGGGGGGGGSTVAGVGAGQCGGGGGGGSVGHLTIISDLPAGDYRFIAGAGGTSSAGNNGQQGGASAITGQGLTYFAVGGAGGALGSTTANFQATSTSNYAPQTGARVIFSGFQGGVSGGGAGNVGIAQATTSPSNTYWGQALSYPTPSGWVYGASGNSAASGGGGGGTTQGFSNTVSLPAGGVGALNVGGAGAASSTGAGSGGGGGGGTTAGAGGTSTGFVFYNDGTTTFTVTGGNGGNGGTGASPNPTAGTAGTNGGGGGGAGGVGNNTGTNQTGGAGGAGFCLVTY